MRLVGTETKFAAALLWALAAGVLLAEKPPFARYQSIIDRQPFGAPPPGFDPNQLASNASKTQADAKSGTELSKEQEQLQKTVSFSILNIETGGRVMVGFTDKSDAKAPRHYYLPVGGTSDGWTVKSADPAANTMVIEKDSIELTLGLGSESVSGGASAPAAGAPAPSVTPRSPLLGSRAPQATPLGGGAGASYQSRRALREAAEKAARERAAAEAARAELQREQTKQELEEMREQMAQEKEEQRRALEALRESQAKLQAEKSADEEDGEDEDAQED